MNKKLEENNYIIVDFISSEEANNYYKNIIDYRNKHPNDFIQDGQCPKSYAIYNYKPFLELLVNKIPYMNKLMEEQMLPTYSYARIYTKGEVLKKHKDRFACEISITLHLGSDGTNWPIWFTDPQGNKIPVELKSGQAAIYKGIVSEHWRDAFEGTEYGQVFLHYVRSNGKNWIRYFDKNNIE